jgi:hypothetical protein
MWSAECGLNKEAATCYPQSQAHTKQSEISNPKSEIERGDAYERSAEHAVHGNGYSYGGNEFGLHKPYAY